MASEDSKLESDGENGYKSETSDFFNQEENFNQKEDNLSRVSEESIYDEEDDDKYIEREKHLINEYKREQENSSPSKHIKEDNVNNLSNFPAFEFLSLILI